MTDRIRSAPSVAEEFNVYLEVYHELIAEVGLAPSGKPNLRKRKRASALSINKGRTA